MKCPRCVQQATPGEESCSHCGYSMAVACGFYGEGSVVAEPLMDVESRLSAGTGGEIRQALAQFSVQFPQLFFMMYLGALPPPASPRQFAFWLLNHAAVQEVDVLLPNERGLLLLVDPPAGSAVLASGYFLENFVAQAELDAVLRAAQRELGRADYPGAVRLIIGGLTGLLKKKAREAWKQSGAAPVGAPAAGAFPHLVRTGEPVMSGEAAIGGEGEPPPAALAVEVAEVAEVAEASAAAATGAPRQRSRRLKPAARRNPPRRS